MWIKEEVTADNFIWDIVWGEAKQTISNLIDEGISTEQIFNAIEDLFPSSEDSPVDVTKVNDFIAYQADDLYEYLGVSDGITSSNKRFVKSGMDTGNYTEEHVDEMDKVLDGIDDEKLNIYTSYNFDATTFFIDVVQRNETTGNSNVWSFSANFDTKEMYELEPYEADLGIFETVSQVGEKIKRCLNGDTSTLEGR